MFSARLNEVVYDFYWKFLLNLYLHFPTLHIIVQHLVYFYKLSLPELEHFLLFFWTFWALKRYQREKRKIWKVVPGVYQNHWLVLKFELCSQILNKESQTHYFSLPKTKLVLGSWHWFNLSKVLQMIRIQRRQI